MTLLNDAEKVNLLVKVLNSHIEKLPKENTCAYYLESVQCFLKTKDSINQKVAFSNSELFIDNLSEELRNRITYRQAIGTLVCAFEKVGYVDSMDAAAIILEFEKLLKEIATEEAEIIYSERWEK